MSPTVYIWDIGFVGMIILEHLYSLPQSKFVTIGELSNAIGFDEDLLEPYLKKLVDVHFVNVEARVYEAKTVSLTDEGRDYFEKEIKPFKQLSS